MTNGKTMAFASWGLRKILKTCFVFACIALLYSFRVVRFLSENIEAQIERICVAFDLIYIVNDPEGCGSEMQPTFTPEQIDLMAKKISNKGMIIQEISDHFKCSYRQAKKIKDTVNILENAPEIQGIHAT